MARPYRIQIHEWAIEAFILPGGEVYDLVWDVTRDAARIAKTLAPVRTGRLVRGIQPQRPKISGVLRGTGEVQSTTSYSRYVIEGTTGPITPRNSKYLKLPATAGSVGPPFIYKKSVRGQAANNFMYRALRSAMTLHGLR